jgi:hypothetical protein
MSQHRVREAPTLAKYLINAWALLPGVEPASPEALAGLLRAQPASGSRVGLGHRRTVRHPQPREVSHRAPRHDPAVSRYEMTPEATTERPSRGGRLCTAT